jgi:hypothetical protein
VLSKPPKLREVRAALAELTLCANRTAPADSLAADEIRADVAGVSTAVPPAT